MNQSSHTGEEIINRKEYEKVFDFYNNHLTIFNIAKDLGVKRFGFRLYGDIAARAGAIFGTYFLAKKLIQIIHSNIFPTETTWSAILTFGVICIYSMVCYRLYKSFINVGSEKLKSLILSIQKYVNPSANQEIIEWHSEKRDKLLYQYREKKLSESNYNINNDLKKILTMIECSEYSIEKSKPSDLKWPAFFFSVVLSVLGPTTSEALSILDTKNLYSLFTFILGYCLFLFIIFLIVFALSQPIIKMYFEFLSSKHDTHKSLQKCLIQMYYNKDLSQKTENTRSKILTK